MKNNYSNQELPHVFFRQSQQSAKGANMFFEGDIIYSYGYHFPIAKIYKNKQGAQLVLFTDLGYSTTTAKHKSLVLRAINGAYCIVPQVLISITESKQDHEKNIDFFIKSINLYIDQAKRASKHGNINISQALQYGRDFVQYVQFFRIKLTKEQKHIYDFIESEQIIPQELRYKVEASRIKAQEAELKRQEKRALAQQEALQDWINGASISSYQFIKTALRIKDEHVETSKGAKVKINSAKILWCMIKAGKDIKGFDIDGYTVIGINGVLKIGCHEIPIDEVNRIGALLDQLKEG